ncbi:MAG: hypothetical protein Q7T57_08260 [Dehalococcoidales bacterium]|nr:hypothetical protein [Dehalococcoidales bacterium]
MPKKEREERAIGIFLEYYNHVNGTSYDINKCEWLDRPPRIRQEPKGPIPDCLCIDAVNGTEMVIERTILTGEQDLELYQEAEKFLADVRELLTCKLPGVFFLYDWGIKAIKFTVKNREQKIAELCQAILKIAPTLVDGEEALLSQPFPVKIRKEDSSKFKTSCALYWDPLETAHSANETQLDQQFGKVLNEANRKFKNYTVRQTVLLINIRETGLNFQIFKTDLFNKVDMGEYPNIKHIYLSEGLPDPPIYHLWST